MIRRLQQELSEITENTTSSETQQLQVKNLQSEIKTLQKTNERLQNSENALKEKCKELQSAVDKYTAQRAQDEQIIKKWQRELDSQKAQVEKQNTEIHELRNSTSEKHEKQIDELKNSLKDALDIHTIHSGKIKTLTKQLETAQLITSAAEVPINKKDSKIQELAKENSALAERLVKLIDQRTKDAESIQRWRKALLARKTQIDILKEKIKTLEERALVTEKTVEQLRAENSSLGKRERTNFETPITPISAIAPRRPPVPSKAAEEESTIKLENDQKPIQIKSEEKSSDDEDKENRFGKQKKIGGLSSRTPLHSKNANLETPTAHIFKKQKTSHDILSPQQHDATPNHSRNEVKQHERRPLISDAVARENKGQARYSTSLTKPYVVYTPFCYKMQTNVMKKTKNRPGERNWLLEDFIVNPNYTAHQEGRNFAFQDVTRNREDRSCLHGTDCTRCREFYEAAGPHAPLPSGPRWNNESSAVNSMSTVNNVKELIEKVSRHRKSWHDQPSPPGFWRSEFPNTQEDEADKAEARRRNEEKVKERYQEAMKNGRYIFREPSLRPAV